MEDKDKIIAELKAENVEIKTSYINFIAKLKREMITKDDIQDLKNTAKKFVEERNSLRFENERLKEENVKLLFGKGTLVEFCNKLTQIIDKKKESENKLLQTLQEIKEIAEAPKPFIDFSEIKTATEVGYDYAAICNELELRLHKVLELITKAESEEE
jgi:regulator of replication initiation timing